MFLMPMREMQMPGGWTMSMMWMRMPGQSWAGAAASFAGMWAAMMLTMMLPAIAPALWRYGRAFGRLAALVGAGYFFVWTAIGMAIYPVGVALAAVEMERTEVARAVPVAVGVVVLIAGALQFTAWKAHHLACCRELEENGGAAWQHGLQLGFHCVCGCAPMTAILLAVGVMDLRAMAAVTAAIVAERVAPNGERLARPIGAVAIAAGLFLIARAVRLA